MNFSNVAELPTSGSNLNHGSVGELEAEIREFVSVHTWLVQLEVLIIVKTRFEPALKWNWFLAAKNSLNSVSLRISVGDSLNRRKAV